MKQGKLFAVMPQLPAGMLYVPEFISREEEAGLLAEIAELPLREAQYKECPARRRIMSYGASYDFSSNELIPAVMRGEAGWGWQHSIPPTKTLRYSITFRTRRIA